MDSINSVVKKTDTFLNWLALMKANGIKTKKELVMHINMHNKTNYLDWEVSRWENKTRSVPRNAHDHMLRELIYFVLHGEILSHEMNKLEKARFLKVKHLTNRRLEDPATSAKAKTTKKGK